MTGSRAIGRRTLAALSAALLLAIVIAGCGPTPPLAPLAEAKMLDAATSDIATACGLTYQVKAFPATTTPPRRSAPRRLDELPPRPRDRRVGAEACRGQQRQRRQHEQAGSQRARLRDRAGE
jgi:hypothetical protein